MRNEYKKANGKLPIFELEAKGVNIYAMEVKLI